MKKLSINYPVINKMNTINMEKLIFGEDIVIFAEKKYDALKWVSNKLDIDNTNNNIVIRSPIMYTNINAIPEKVAGMTYVKTIFHHK